jgi:DNA-binding response OmpR family regulator
MRAQGRVLFVSGDRPLRALLKMAFKDDTLTTAFASTAAQAHEFLQAERYDLVVVDMELPDGKGLAFVEEARALPGNDALAAIAVAATAEKSFVLSAARLKVAGIMLKPVNMRDLHARIEELLAPPADAPPPA